MTRTALVIQARMTSTRLPGKVLRPLAGKPLLGYLVERMRQAEEPQSLIVATSAATTDDPIAQFCEEMDLLCHRGPLEDVAGRFLEVAERMGAEHVVRVSGDSPLLDPALVDHVLRLDADDFDLVTNVAPRTFPPGQSVELIRSATLKRVYPQMSADDKEHVTRRLYDSPSVRVLNFERDPPVTHIPMTVDTEADVARLEAVLHAMSRPHWTYGLDQLIQLFETTLAGGALGGSDG